MDKRDLLLRVLRGSATKKQRQELEEWLSSLENKQSSGNPGDIATPSDIEAIKGIAVKALKDQRRRRLVIAAVSIAAVVFLIVLFPFRSKETTFIFHHATIRQIVAQLESSYGVRITVLNQHTLDCSFTAEFYNVQSPEDALSELAKATGLEFKKTTNDQFQLLGMACN